LLFINSRRWAGPESSFIALMLMIRSPEVLADFNSTRVTPVTVSSTIYWAPPSALLMTTLLTSPPQTQQRFGLAKMIRADFKSARNRFHISHGRVDFLFTFVFTTLCC
jgi:hypothetical protein